MQKRITTKVRRSEGIIHTDEILFLWKYAFKAIELNSRKTVNVGDGKELDKEARGDTRASKLKYDTRIKTEKNCLGW